MLEYNEERHNLAKAIINKRKFMKQYVEDCFEANICPACGGINIKISHDFDNDFKEFKCKDCEFTYE